MTDTQKKELIHVHEHKSIHSKFRHELLWDWVALTIITWIIVNIQVIQCHERATVHKSFVEQCLQVNSTHMWRKLSPPWVLRFVRKIRKKHTMYLQSVGQALTSMYSCKIFFQPTAVWIIPAFLMFCLSFSLIHSTHNKNPLHIIIYILHLIYTTDGQSIICSWCVSTVCYIAFVSRYTVSIGTNVVHTFA